MSLKPRQPLITRPRRAAALGLPQAVMNCAAPLRPRICQRSGKRHLTGLPSIFKTTTRALSISLFKVFMPAWSPIIKAERKKNPLKRERAAGKSFFALPLRHSCVRQSHTQVRTRLRDTACSCRRGCPPAAPSARPWV